MLRRLGSRLHQSSGPIALFLVLTGGVAYAASTIGSADVIDNSLQSVDLKNNDVRGADIRDGGITDRDLAPQSIGSVGQSTSVNPDDFELGTFANQTQVIAINDDGRSLLSVPFEASLSAHATLEFSTQGPSPSAASCELSYGPPGGPLSPMGHSYFEADEQGAWTMNLTSGSNVPSGTYFVNVECYEGQADDNIQFLHGDLSVVAVRQNP